MITKDSGVSQNILLLQGPVGPFFNHFAKELEQGGHTVHKINFNGGDEFFYSRKNTYAFTGKMEDWRDFIGEKLRTLNIRKMYLLGDCRAYHDIARKIAQAEGIKVYVFEEGYIRPNCITLEELGVNGHSKLPRNPALYPYTIASDTPTPKQVPYPFYQAALYSIGYYVAASLKRGKFPHYEHHRPLNVFNEGSKWVVGGIRKMWYTLVDQDITKPLINEGKPYFLCPLQVHTDMQVKVHSRFKNIEEFIQDVIHSFANHAPDNSLLVFKHHPMDRGYKDYTRVIRVLSKLHKIEKRVRYVHDGHLPTLFDNASGTVTINSTTGLSSIDHGTPVIALGDAVYDLPGLAYQGRLDDFWRSGSSIDVDMRDRFRAYLLSHVQANGNFYRKLPDAKTETGIVWPPAIAAAHHLASDSSPSRTASRPIAQPVPPVSAAMDLGRHYDGRNEEVGHEAAEEITYSAPQRKKAAGAKALQTESS